MNLIFNEIITILFTVSQFNGGGLSRLWIIWGLCLDTWLVCKMSKDKLNKKLLFKTEQAQNGVLFSTGMCIWKLEKSFFLDSIKE
jgi:hypothetical protein